MTRPFLVLGLGNELFTDEGVGVVAARGFAERGLPGVEVVDGGTLGIALLPTVVDREAVLVFDAVVAADAEPGAIVVLEDADVRRGHRVLYSAHQLGISEVLAAADLAGAHIPRVAAVGMVPFSLETGYGISPEAAARIDAMVDHGVAIVERWRREVTVDA